MRASVSKVVFDIGNVLIQWNPEFLYSRLIPDAKERKTFLETVCTTAWNEQQDLGRPWPVAVDLLSARHPDQADLIAAYSERWHEMVPGPIPGTPEILAELKASGTPLYAITNFSTEKFAESQVRFPFLGNCFLDIAVSGAEECIKPGRQIYEILLERNRLDPRTCIFIDDSLANIEAARALGMTGHHFKDATSLRRDLEELGLLAGSVQES